MTYALSAGKAAPLGATVDGDGVNFAVFSEHATAMYLCLFDEDGTEHRLALPERDGDVWHGHVAGIGAGQHYGFRAQGPYRPDEGHRFNPNKLLIDPYARRLTGHPVWHDALHGYDISADAADLSFDTRDSAPYMPRSVVEDFAAPPSAHPETPIPDTIVYEAHVKGLTAAHPAIPNGGTFLAAGSEPIIEHLVKLGVTAIEFLPVHAFINDRFLVDKGLTNYWGYQSIGFFAPDPRYLSGGRISQFRQMVDAFHEAGIEVLLDVVYNHSGEGDQTGPTLCFRGLDNASYYRLERDKRYYVNDTGTGNTLNIDHPMVLRMVMDSLRYWVSVMGVDGFRFDLASVLGREPNGFDRGAAFFDAIRQDPVLTGVKLIAEPWDIGPGGYQLGGFPPPFLEWNDKFRDGVRRFWRADPGRAPDLADRLTGSARQFDHSGRPATASVNFLTAHDGMTLEDTVSYSRKHNMANGEDGRDGHSEDFSDNMGVEGTSHEPEIVEARARRKRAMMATLLLSQGTPMILGGDEIGNSQQGNNNAYNQDNETAWIDWEAADEAFLKFTADLIAFRKAHPILRQKLFLHSRERMVDGVEDLFWWREDGTPMQTLDWHDPSRAFIAVEKRMAAGTPAYAALEYAILMVFNAAEKATEFKMPAAPEGQLWCHEIDTGKPDHEAGKIARDKMPIGPQSVSVFVLVADDGAN
ncbi:glycogen debranching protein GlgX [Alphaproteobacteria bacterium GH1-50]|uniref:Glycogen debranching protein GlgX n=1 Tax=Kangsaoukella pontilimi TaxID=2691042 RepID=A0A7C9IIL7_9RHOB|nr:glycogen debranching protein GlgX [Kangsaoukella pontilimi]MXQ09409.1 glycogen debranching protein GlgX [Kangsaoukella pontilimi]